MKNNFVDTRALTVLWNLVWFVQSFFIKTREVHPSSAFVKWLQSCIPCIKHSKNTRHTDNNLFIFILFTFVFLSKWFISRMKKRIFINLVWLELTVFIQYNLELCYQNVRQLTHYTFCQWHSGLFPFTYRLKYRLSITKS